MGNIRSNYKESMLESPVGPYGKADDSGLKGPGFNPRLRQEKWKTNLYYFWLVALEPMRSTLSTTI